MICGPGQLLDRQAGGAELGLERPRALLVDLLEREAEALDVAGVPAGRHEDGERDGRDRAQLLGDGLGHLGVLEREVAQQLDAEADVALLVERRRSPCPSRKPGSRSRAVR